MMAWQVTQERWHTLVMTWLAKSVRMSQMLQMGTGATDYWRCIADATGVLQMTLSPAPLPSLPLARLEQVRLPAGSHASSRSSSRCFPPRHPTHVQPSFLDLYGIL